MDGAEQIAKDTLLANCNYRIWKAGKEYKNKKILLTGGKKFEEVWARDAGFSLSAIADPAIIRSTLEAFFDHQRTDGLLPRRLSGMSNLTRNVRAALRKRGIPPPRVSKRIKPEYTVLGLVRQNPREDWADHTNRDGSVFYTNLLTWRSLHDITLLLTQYGDDQAERYATQTAYHYDRIQTVFWNEEQGHFINFIDKKQHAHKNFSTPENMLAIITGFATPEQRRRIILRLEQAVNEHGYVPIVSPAYSPHMTPWMRRQFVKKYNEGGIMIPWIQSLTAEAVSYDSLEFARTLLDQVGESITHHGTCLEVLENGKPLSMFFTDIEKQFTWTAAMYLLANERIKATQEPTV